MTSLASFFKFSKFHHRPRANPPPCIKRHPAQSVCYRKRMQRLLPTLLAAAALASAQPSDVKTGTLANGMKILIQEDHNIPNVAMYFFFKVGSRNERPGITGISHFFEHMMFNGAKKYGPGQFDTEMEKNGGNNNAYTTKDDTVYTDWFPSARSS